MYRKKKPGKRGQSLGWPDVFHPLRFGLNRGDVVITDGKSLKGQRNLDAVADKIVGELLDLLKRQGVLV